MYQNGVEGFEMGAVIFQRSKVSKVSWEKLNGENEI
ncbi:MAG: hypothetical protein SCAL_001096 [Candidatus Syntrophoarchaeum caldarius]|uniref:Uncharacterized protein n=1 Tax=Candidatus Syntropharchaeum caldarium TaxID=1838285 RepID=A0A1F2PAK2_9EURY|nr:MAG: hypothetical protein SCAL_001096 [Candidatus Syntrophoarchaeum caldarius]